MAEFDEKNVKKTVIDLNALDYFYQCFHDIVLPRISVLAATSTIEEADSFNKDRIYMVPKEGTYAGYENLKPGDLLISDGTKWNVIPHADADSGIKFYGIQLVVNSAEQICYIEKDGVIQTYDLIKAAYESQTDFLFLEYNSRIYLPTIKNGDIIFNTTSIDSINNVSYSNNYQITVSSDNGVTISSITSESIENKISSLEGWTIDQLTYVYPTADAVVKAINAQKVAITETSEEGSDGTFLVSTGDADPIEIKIKGLNNAAYKDIDASIDDTLETLSENLPTSKAVVEYIKTEFGNMTEPMVYEGTVGNGGDIETLPEDTSTIKNGATYKVISKMTVGDITAKSGDVFIWNDKGSVGKWDFIPSADEINTLETVKINGVALEPDSDKAVNISISTDAEKNGILTVNDEDLPVYEHPTGEGFNHIPEGGTVGQILVNDAEGSVKWDDIPNASLTMQKNGETIGTFTSNASEDVEINIELGDAADMGVDTELSEESTDENVPTSKTVYEAVEASKIAENNSYDNSNSGLIAENVQSAIDETMSKIKDIELFKFPNATIIGTPTINNGQVSGFSASNYMKFPFIVNMQGRPFVIDIAFTTGSDVTNQQNIIDGLDHGIAFAIRDGKFIIVLSSKSGEWDISNGERVSDQIVTANTSYRVRLSWDGSVYTFEYSTNGETYTEATSMRVASSLSLYPTQINIGVTSGLGGIFKGIINMNYCSLTISNKVVWTGMDDVGLATRMAVDMSNIDEAGENKVRSIIGDLPTKESLELDNVTNDKQVKGLETGTTAGHLVSWGSDGYTVADTGATIINTDINVEADKDNVPTAGAVKTAIESATSGMQKCLGTINSLTELNTEAKIGNYYRVKTAWKTGDIDVHVSDVLIAEKDNPEQKIDGENWSLLHNEMDTDTTYQFQSGTTNGNFQFKSSSESSWNDISIYGLNDAAYMPIETSITEESDDNILPTSKAVVDYITEEIAGLTKVESSEINGNIKIDDVETPVYEHPTQTAKTSGMYKITVDETGHVSDAVDATAIDLSFDNEDTQITSEDVQGAIVESFIPVYTQAEFESIKDDIKVGQKFIISDDQNEHGGGASSADKVSYDNTSSGLESDNVQTAIDELNIRCIKTPVDETAEVGQCLYVAEVDEDGNPVKWTYTKPEPPDPLAPIMDKDISELTYDEIAMIVRAGRAEEKFTIGDQIITKYTTTDGAQYDMPFDVVAFREVELEDTSKVPGMIIQSHYATVEDMQFDAPEPSSSDSNVRSAGWNRWMYSNIRQWLNSDKAKGLWWTSAHSYDAAPSNLNTVNGFMKGLPTDFINMLKPTKHETALNYVYPSGSETTYVYDTTYDVFFLPSLKEEHFKYSQYPNRYDGSDREGSTWEYWIQRKGETAQDIGSANANTNAIRYSLADKSTAKYVWLRSANRSYSSSEFSVNTTGYYNYHFSYNSNGCSPACIIC